MLVGLKRALRGENLSAVVNVGDDDEIYGVRVCPDIDIVTYWLAGIADIERGWGIRDDTFKVVDSLAPLGEEAWFRLGDRDLATCLHRTSRLADGVTLSAITAEIATSLGAGVDVLPATDDRLRTKIETLEGRLLSFQEFFVAQRAEPSVTRVLYEGEDSAKPAPGVLDAIHDADVVVMCPSNPLLSIGPILAVAAIREALAEHPRVVAVTPLVQGRALKGPADRMMRDIAGESSASAVARLYSDVCDLFVVDVRDPAEVARVQGLGIRAVALDSVMSDHAAAERFARALLDHVGEL